MKKRYYLIGGGVLLLLIGVIVWLVLKNQDDGYATPTIKPPPRGEDNDTTILSGSGTAIPPTVDTGNGNQTITVSVKDQISLDAIEEWSENISDNVSDVNRIRGKYDIGDSLFDGIPYAKEELIINLFKAVYPQIDTSNYSNLPIFPIQGVTGQSQYDDFSRIMNYTESDLSNQPYPPSINLVVSGFAWDWSKPSGRLSDGSGGKPELGKGSFANVKVGATFTIQFFENCKNEVERFGRVIELEAIRVLIEGGWRFKEWNATTIEKALEEI